MTLPELVSTLNLKGEISIPSTLNNFKIENAADFCRHSQKKYLKSIDFKSDLIEILNCLLENHLIPYEDIARIFSLQFVKDNNKLHLKLTEDFIESF